MTCGSSNPPRPDPPDAVQRPEREGRMRHFRAWAAGALAAAVVIGCGPGKQLPDEVPKSNTTERTTAEPKEKIPTVSDPAAKEIVDRAIKAFTQNNPDLLAKGKLSKVTANGTVKLPAE